MSFAIVVFPGSNCDRDCFHVVSEILGMPARFVWHQEQSLPADVDCVVLPGGFSYGDYLRAGAVARISPIMDAVIQFARAGGKVLGICNGFQILLEVGLLPGAMLRNRALSFICAPTLLRLSTSRATFTRAIEPDRILQIPIAHAEGNYTLDEDGIKRLQDQDQIVFQYVDEAGVASAVANPNGSLLNIAGICNEDGNVLGMMPHPERAAEQLLGSVDGLAVFESILG